MKQLSGKSLVGRAFDLLHSGIYYSGFLFLVLAFTDVYVRYERVGETQQWLNDQLTKFDEIQREEIGDRHRRAVKDENVVVAGIETKFAQLELRYDNLFSIEVLQSNQTILVSTGGGGGPSIVKVPGDVPPARVYFFKLSSLTKGILFANSSLFSMGKGMLFVNVGRF